MPDMSRLLAALPAPLRSRLVAAAAGGAMALALSLVGYFEGRELVPYLDVGGVPTVCDGHTGDVDMNRRYTEAECDAFSARDIAEARAIFDRWVPADVRSTLSPLTVSAFLSFIYNVGPGKPDRAGRKGKDGFVWLKSGRHSTMLVLLQQGRIREACAQLPQWTRAGGVVYRGLVKRRTDERALCVAGLEGASK